MEDQTSGKEAGLQSHMKNLRKPLPTQLLKEEKCGEDPPSPRPNPEVKIWSWLVWGKNTLAEERTMKNVKSLVLGRIIPKAAANIPGANLVAPKLPEPSPSNETRCWQSREARACSPAALAAPLAGLLRSRRPGCHGPALPFPVPQIVNLPAPVSG